MFTGLVEEVGEIAGLRRVSPEAVRLRVRCEQVLGDAAVGDSIAVAGCCLTVEQLTDDGFACDLMAETLRATALGDLGPGDAVNLERALPADGRLGGHLVQGHVDAVGEVVDRVEEPGTTWLDVAAPPSVARYLVPKGSVTVDGTSLTVVTVHDHADGTATFRVGLIPHTLAVTTHGRLAVGSKVNLEADVIAKYAERLLAGGGASPYRAESSS